MLRNPMPPDVPNHGDKNRVRVICLALNKRFLKIIFLPTPLQNHGPRLWHLRLVREHTVQNITDIPGKLAARF